MQSYEDRIPDSFSDAIKTGRIGHKKANLFQKKMKCSAFFLSGLTLLFLIFPAHSSFANFCSNLKIPSCYSIEPRDFIFIIDISGSMNQTVVDTTLTFAQQLFCSFDNAVGSRVGLMTFGTVVEMRIPLQQLTTSQWYGRCCFIFSS